MNITKCTLSPSLSVTVILCSKVLKLQFLSKSSSIYLLFYGGYVAGHSDSAVLVRSIFPLLVVDALAHLQNFQTSLHNTLLTASKQPTQVAAVCEAAYAAVLLLRLARLVNLPGIRHPASINQPSQLDDLT